LLHLTNFASGPSFPNASLCFKRLRRPKLAPRDIHSWSTPIWRTAPPLQPLPAAENLQGTFYSTTMAETPDPSSRVSLALQLQLPAFCKGPHPPPPSVFEDCFYPPLWQAQGIRVFDLHGWYSFFPFSIFFLAVRVTPRGK